MPERAAQVRRKYAKDRWVLQWNRIPPATWREFRPGDYRVTPRWYRDGAVRSARSGSPEESRLLPTRVAVPAAIADGSGKVLRALTMGARLKRVVTLPMLRAEKTPGNRRPRISAGVGDRLSRQRNAGGAG
jgi:hypothetical protein